jgi:hypothetical protein
MGHSDLDPAVHERRPWNAGQKVGPSPDEVRALRKDVVTTCATVMRDCHDPAVRAEAYDVLASMKELR